MKKLWYITIFYSHIESYKHLNRNHMKDRKGKCFIDTVLGARQPWYLQFGIVDVTIPETGTSNETLRWHCFLGCPCPCRWQAVCSQEPHWSCDEHSCHSRWEWCHLLFISQGSCGQATPLRFYILETSVPGGGVQQRVLLYNVTLSQMPDDLRRGQKEKWWC